MTQAVHFVQPRPGGLSLLEADLLNVFAGGWDQRAAADQPPCTVKNFTLLRSSDGDLACLATQQSGLLGVRWALDLLEELETPVPEQAASPMAKLKLKGRQRKRASKAETTKATLERWNCGESF